MHGPWAFLPRFVFALLVQTTSVHSSSPRSCAISFIAPADIPPFLPQVQTGYAVLASRTWRHSDTHLVVSRYQ
eukprot:12937590-Prorocentrum_lima.AAC.1